MWQTSTVWNQRTNRQPCNHDTQPKAWVQGRLDSARDWVFVEINSMSWKFDKRIKRADWASLVAQCFGEFADTYGSTRETEPKYWGTRPAPDFRNREARIVIREDLGRERGCYKIFVSFVTHDDECYV